jgi:methionyl-tRNA formyltransferase
MHLVEKLDAGDVLLQEKTPISQEDTAETLHDRLAQIGARLIVPTLKGLDSGELRGVAQDESLITYASKLSKEMEALDSSLEAVVLERRVRALNPWPGTSLVIDGQRLKVKKARIRSDLQGNQGKIYERSGMLLLGTSQGALELLSVQWDGKKEVDASGFMNGLKGKGQSLPLSTG